MGQNMGGYVKGTSKALRQRRTRGHKVTNDLNAAIYGNLSQGIRASKGQMTAQGRRVTSKIAALQERSGKLGKRKLANVTRAEQAAIGSFGATLMAGSGRSYMSGIKAAGKASDIGLAGVKKGVKKVAKSGTTALDIAQAGAAEAKAGADYYTGAALKERTSADIQFIAGLRHDISMTKLQADLERQRQQREFEYQKKLARFEANLLEKEEGPETMAQVRPFVSMLTEVTPRVLDMHENGVPTADISAKLIEEGLINQDEAPAIEQYIRRLTNNNEEGPDNIISELVRSVPGWSTLGKGKKDRLRDWIKKELAATIANQRDLYGHRSDETEEDLLETDVPEVAGPTEEDREAYREAIRRGEEVPTLEGLFGTG